MKTVSPESSTYRCVLFPSSVVESMALFFLHKIVWITSIAYTLKVLEYTCTSSISGMGASIYTLSHGDISIVPLLEVMLMLTSLVWIEVFLLHPVSMIAIMTRSVITLFLMYIPPLRKKGGTNVPAPTERVQATESIRQKRAYRWQNYLNRLDQQSGSNYTVRLFPNSRGKTLFHSAQSNDMRWRLHQ